MVLKTKARDAPRHLQKHKGNPAQAIQAGRQKVRGGGKQRMCTQLNTANYTLTFSLQMIRSILKNEAGGFASYFPPATA